MSSVTTLLAEVRTGYPEDLTDELLDRLAQDTVKMILDDDDPSAIILPLVRTLAYQQLVRADTRNQEHQHAREHGYGTRKGKRHWKASPTAADSLRQRGAPSFLEARVYVPVLGTTVQWGDVTREYAESIMTFRKSQYESMRVGYNFAFEQFTLLATTSAASLREAYEIDKREVPETDPGA